ncbi:WD40 repeat-like protein [Coprinellus micaceus]|uniref:WD40 repeat-like protein n=1 Tax=Coprinellus micaceus TaxID=71717 RepID=A0A4Y7SBM4_COPMI|nr:WD40 repeat-like protein [Coprinellus micaceus]
MRSSMADQPPRDSKTTRVKRWLHRKTDRAKDLFRTGTSSDPGSSIHSQGQTAASLPDIPLGVVLNPGLASLEAARSSHDLVAVEGTSQVPYPSLIDDSSSGDGTSVPQDQCVGGGQSSETDPTPTGATITQTSSDPFAQGPDDTLAQASPGPAAEELVASQGTLVSADRPADGKPSQTSSTFKDVAKVSLNFTQTLLKKLPDVLDGNPVKIALGLVKMGIEIKDVVKENMDAVERRIASTCAQLEVVGDARISSWGPQDPKRPLWLVRFERTLKEEMVNLQRLTQGSTLRKIADHEDEKALIAAIFERINEARILLQLDTQINIARAVVAIEAAILRTLSNDLKPSHKADHKTDLGGGSSLPRQTCTPGTRIGPLRAIVGWANGTSPECQDVFWLFGPAGSGKSTIAYTVAQRFEAAVDADDTITLGGNFMCSRQYEETRTKACIVRTLVYHLAHKCKGFANALNETGNFDTIYQSVSAQLNGLLVIPWHHYLSSSSDIPRFMFLIDAADEIEQQGGSEFLRELLTMINDNRLPGLKFFVTSRSDPDILVRLQDIEEEEVKRDIETYLEANLPLFRGTPEMEHVREYAWNLFICAATIVRQLTQKRARFAEQKILLEKLIPRRAQKSTSQGATHLLDNLYMQILSEAFGQFHDDFLPEKLCIFHAFLCTLERTSTAVVSGLLFPVRDPSSVPTDVVDDIVSCLHAVVYIDGNKNILSYHKSFTDFVFDKSRSGKFACDQPSQHRLLANSCFRVMTKGLRFNIANIPSSFLLDSEIPDLERAVKENVLPELSYACRGWSPHLSMALCIPSDPFFAILTDFVGLQVLFWIEAMNLLKCQGQCDHNLQQASRWVRANDPALAQQLMEAASFALSFSGSPASASSPHLYVSSLATCSPGQGLAATWKHHFPRVPIFIATSFKKSSALTQIRLPSFPFGLAVSADGTQIICGLYTNSIQIYEASTGKTLRVLEGHMDDINSVAMSADMTWIVSGSDDHSIRIWDTSTGKVLETLEGHTDQVWSVAISADGAHIVSGSADKSIRIWEAATGKQLQVLDGHTGTVNSVATSPCAAHIVSGSDDKSIHVWDLATGNTLKVMEGHGGAVKSVVISADGTHVISGSADTSVRVWSISTGKQLQVLEGHTASVSSVAISSTTSHVISGSDDQTVRIWDLSTGEALKVLTGHTSWVCSVVISSDGTRIISGSMDSSVCIWDAAVGRGWESLESYTNNAVASSPGETQITSGSSRPSSTLQQVTSIGGKLDSPEGHTEAVLSVAVSADGTWLISGSLDKTIQVWDTSTGKQLGVLEGTVPVKSVAISADGAYIVSGSVDKLVRVWDGATGQELKVLQGHTGWVYAVAISTDVTHIVSGSEDQLIRIWDMASSKELRVLEGHTGEVRSVTISSDGASIVSGSGDMSVRIWDMATGGQLKVLKGHTSTVNSVAISNDMTCIVSGSNNHSIRIWDFLMGKEMQLLEGHEGAILSVAISADGRHIVSGSADQSVRVWETATGKELAVVEGHTGWVTSVAFTPDGKAVISGSSPTPQSGGGFCKEGGIRTAIGKRQRKGWILSKDQGDRLMFVHHSMGLPSPHLIRIFPTPKFPPPTVNFGQAALGPDWHECYIADPDRPTFS